MKHQVITGDFVDSSSFSGLVRNGLKRLLETYGTAAPQNQLEYFIRGDGIQILTTGNALREALYLKCLFHAKLNVSVRFSIGIGEVSNLEPKLSDSVGEAFVLSGQQLDLMKAERSLIAVRSSDDWLTDEWRVHAKVLDYLEVRRTQNQSEAIVGLLENKTQTQLAAEIGISQPSVNQRIKASGWELIEAIVNRYGTLLNFEQSTELLGT